MNASPCVFVCIMGVPGTHRGQERVLVESPGNEVTNNCKQSREVRVQEQNVLLLLSDVSSLRFLSYSVPLQAQLLMPRRASSSLWPSLAHCVSPGG